MVRPRTIAAVALLLAVTSFPFALAIADDGEDTDALPAAAADAGMHAPLDRLLKAHVGDDGSVDYAGVKRHVAVLDGYIRELRTTDPADLSRDAQLALWINAYNAFTLRLIVRHYPGIESIMHLDEPWKQREWTVNGRRYSLDQIENEIIRPTFDEPRIHFAINCASRSCPPLRAEAYVAGRLESQLREQTRVFLNNSRDYGVRVRLVDGKLQIHLSQIFNWFADDFRGDDSDVIDWIAERINRGTRQLIERHVDNREVHYMEYDWTLNGA